MVESSKSRYHVIFNNCADAVTYGLYAAGLNGAQDIENDTPIPNRRFQDIQKVNHESLWNIVNLTLTRLSRTPTDSIPRIKSNEVSRSPRYR